MPQPYYGGPEADQSALAQLFQASIQGAQAAAELKARGYGEGLALAVAGIDRGLQRRHERVESEAERRLRMQLSREAEAGAAARQGAGQDFAAGEAALGRTFQAGEGEKARTFSAEQARIDRTQQQELQKQDALNAFLRTMAGAGAEQGFPAPGLLERGMQMMQSQPGFGENGVGVPPGGPGGYMVGQESGGYQKLMQEGGLFGGLERMAEPPSVEGQRFQRQQLIDENTRKAIMEMSGWARDSKNQKGLYIPTEMTGIEAFGWQNLSKAELDKRVVSAFPDTRPVAAVGEGMEADRSALDAKIKELNEKFYFEVPDEYVWGQVKGELASKYGSDAAVAALNEFEPQYATERGARGPRSAREIVRGKVLDILGAQKGAQSTAQLQGGGDLLDMLTKGTLAAEDRQAAVAPPKTAVWNKALIDRAGLDYSQIAPELQSAALNGFEIGPGPSGGIEFLPRQDGVRPTAKWQAALKKLLDDPKKGRELRAILAQPEQQMTPSEVEKAGATRQVLGADQRSPTPAQPPGASKSAGQGTSNDQPGSAPPPRRSAVEEWQASRKPAAPPKPPAAKKSDPRLAAPPSMSLVGLPESAIMELLLGGPNGLMLR